MPAANSTFAIVGVSCSTDSFVVNESVVLRMNICGENPAHRKSAKRYMQALPSVRFLLTSEASPDFYKYGGAQFEIQNLSTTRKDHIRNSCFPEWQDCSTHGRTTERHYSTGALVETEKQTLKTNVRTGCGSYILRTQSQPG